MERALSKSNGAARKVSVRMVFRLWDEGGGVEHGCGFNPGELSNSHVHHAGRQLGRAREGSASEGAGEQFEDVRALHVPAESAQELERLEGTFEQARGEQQSVALHA